MKKVIDALKILRALGMPRHQQNDRSALTLLALGNVKQRRKWADVEQPLLRIWDIMGFMRTYYGKNYAANSRETIRRQTIHQFEQARIVDRNPDDPSRPTNSGKNVYALTDDILPVLRAYGTASFDSEIAAFTNKFGLLHEAYAKRRKLQEVQLTPADGSSVSLSPGKHNELQVAVIERFAPQFAPGANLLYLGDTAKKHVMCDHEVLSKLSIGITEHDKLPDIVLYDKNRNWLFLIEAVTSHGPVNAKRHTEMERMFADCPAERIYITAFLTRSDFRTHAAEIAWETEVWIAENPGHMIHFNGPKFLGPYQK
jgi:adenine-specific DNA-methyltransferase